MKKIWIILGLFLVCQSAIFAQKITVLSQNSEYEIYVDGKYVANKSIQDYVLPPGNHYIQVEKKGMIISRKQVTVADGTTVTVYVDDFVDVPTTADRIPNRGAKEKETVRIRESRGNLAVGLHFSSGASGLSGKYFFTDRFGVQLVGWAATEQNHDLSSFGYRLIYNLSDNLTRDNIVTLYLALGAGTTSSLHYFPYLIEVKSMQEGVLGVEFPGFFQNSYFSFELGYEQLVSTYRDTYRGFKWNTGAHLYF